MSREIVMACGCFDVLHYGHLLHLQEAKAQGDWLIVALTSDEQVAAQKGAGHPMFKYEQRKAMLEALRCVDEVLKNDTPTPHDLINHIRPNVYAKGREYMFKLPEQEAVESYGGRVHFTTGEVYSSTRIINALRQS